MNSEAVTPVPTSVFEFLLNIACGSVVAGTYEGTNSATYGAGGQGEQKDQYAVGRLRFRRALSRMRRRRRHDHKRQNLRFVYRNRIVWSREDPMKPALVSCILV